MFTVAGKFAGQLAILEAWYQGFAGVEKPYAFVSMAQLVIDFNADVSRYLEGDDNESDL